LRKSTLAGFSFNPIEKYYIVKMGIFPEIGVKITKYLSCHHLERCFPRVARHLTPLLLVDRDLELQDHLKTADAEGSIQGVGEKPFL